MQQAFSGLLHYLRTFNFDIKCRAGKHNGDADGLSRRPHGDLEDNIASEEERQKVKMFTSHLLKYSSPVNVLDMGTVQATCQRHLINQDFPLDQSLGYVESLAIQPTAIPTDFEEQETECGISSLPKYNEADLMRL